MRNVRETNAIRRLPSMVHLVCVRTVRVTNAVQCRTGITSRIGGRARMLRKFECWSMVWYESYTTQKTTRSNNNKMRSKFLELNTPKQIVYDQFVGFVVIIEKSIT